MRETLGLLDTGLSWVENAYTLAFGGLSSSAPAPATSSAAAASSSQRRYVPETLGHAGRFDLAGAATATLGITSLVYGIVRSTQIGSADRLTLAAVVAGGALLILFVLNEARAKRPITPLRLFASGERTAPTSRASSSSARTSASSSSSSSPSSCKERDTPARSSRGSRSSLSRFPAS